MYSTIEDATAIAKPQCARSLQSRAYLAVRVVQGTVVTLRVLKALDPYTRLGFRVTP